MKNNLSILFTIITIMLTSCVETLKSIPGNYISTNNLSVVIGEVVLPESEFLMIGNQFYFTDGGGITLVNCNTKKEYQIVPEKDENKKNYFYIALPSGKYIINGIKWGDIIGHPRIIFEINENGNVYYIGTIKIEKIKTTTGQNIASWFTDNIKAARNIPMRYSIIDNYETALKLFNEKHPNVKPEIIKSLVFFGN